MLTLLALLAPPPSLAYNPVGKPVQVLVAIASDRPMADAVGAPYFRNAANCWREGKLVNPADPIHADFCRPSGKQENCVLRVNTENKTALRNPQGRVEHFLMEPVSDGPHGASYYQSVLELRLEGASSASLTCYNIYRHMDLYRMLKLAEGLIKLEP